MSTPTPIPTPPVADPNAVTTYKIGAALESFGAKIETLAVKDAGYIQKYGAIAAVIILAALIHWHVL